jgi:hypothetical protein
MIMNRTRKIRTTLALALLGASLAAGTPALAHDDHGSPDGLTAAQRRVIVEATSRFRDVDVALGAGYVATDQCSALPGVGAMGYHFVNPALTGDGRIDPTTPDVLLYEKARDGRWRLVGVEYMAFDADQNPATDGDRPTMMGHPLEGPMPGHQPGMPVHYDLHAWVYKNNPTGELSAWNPDVRCP